MCCWPVCNHRSRTLLLLFGFCFLLLNDLIHLMTPDEKMFEKEGLPEILLPIVSHILILSPARSKTEYFALPIPRPIKPPFPSLALVTCGSHKAFSQMILSLLLCFPQLVGFMSFRISSQTAFSQGFSPVVSSAMSLTKVYGSTGLPPGCCVLTFYYVSPWIGTFTVYHRDRTPLSIWNDLTSPNWTSPPQALCPGAHTQKS